MNHSHLPQLHPDYTSDRGGYHGAGKSPNSGFRHARGGKDREKMIAAEVKKCRRRIDADTRRRERAAKAAAKKSQ